MLIGSKRAYYYLIAGLPDLQPDEVKSKTLLSGIKEEILQHLHPDDKAVLENLFLPIDNRNLLLLVSKSDKPFEEGGSFTSEQLEEQLKEPTQLLPEYMQQFIHYVKDENHESVDKSLEVVLEEMYFEQMLTIENEFLAKWYEFQLNLGNLSAAINCRKHQIPLESQLIGNNSITESLLRSNARDFGIGQEFHETEVVVSAFEDNNITQREKALDNLRWQWLEENVFFHYFTLEKVIAFMLQLQIVERWMKLDYEEGSRLFKELVNKLGNSYTLPEDFTIQRRSS